MSSGSMIMMMMMMVVVVVVDHRDGCGARDERRRHAEVETRPGGMSCSWGFFCC
jgi:hypothetical protein